MPYKDPAKHLENKRRWHREKYASDPEYRERVRSRSRVSHPTSGARIREYARTHYDYRSRARAFGCEYEPVDKVSVFERDGWVCRRCGKTTDKGAFEARRWDNLLPNPNYPTLGHVVALSLGGAHTNDNVACECYRCNVTAGADEPLPPSSGCSSS